MTLTAETASGFYHFRQAKFSQNVCDRSSPNFRIGSPAGVDDCCKLALRSLNGRCHGNQFLFTRSTDFFRDRQRPMCNTVCAFGHDALDGRRCNTRGRRSTSSVDHAHQYTDNLYVDICLESISGGPKNGATDSWP